MDLRGTGAVTKNALNASEADIVRGKTPPKELGNTCRLSCVMKCGRPLEVQTEIVMNDKYHITNRAYETVFWCGIVAIAAGIVAGVTAWVGI